MNKFRNKLNLYHFLFLFTLSGNALWCQSKSFSFAEAPLIHVIDSIEKNSTFIFNYDPASLNEQFYSGEILLDSKGNFLSDLLYATPFAFEENGQTVLIYKAPSRSYKICGFVKDAQTQEVLISANVSAINQSQGSQSNIDGYFEFDLIADKNQIIELSYLGYETTSFMVQELNDAECPTYRLAINEALFGDQIIIKDYILDGINQGDSYSGFDLNFGRLSKNHSTVEHDILKTIQLLPGINSIDDSATNLQIRGSSPDQNLLLWEGAPIYNAGHIFGMISAINPFSVEGVKVFKGAYDPKYDNRVGGIVDISLADEIENDFHGSIGSTLTELHGNFDIPIIKNRLSLLLAARRSTRDLFNSTTLESYTDQVFQYSLIDDLAQETEEGIVETQQDLGYFDWNGKMIYKVSDRIQLSLGAYQNEQDFKYGFSYEGDPFQSRHNISVKTKILHGNINRKHNDRWTSLISWHNSSYDNTYSIRELEGEVFLREFNQVNGVDEQNFTFSNQLIVNPKISFNLGYEYNSKNLNLDLGEEIDFEPGVVDKINETVDFHNVFLSTKLAHKKWKTEGGLRSSYLQKQDEWVHSPRINLQYSITDGLKLKADAGVYHQFISQTNSFGLQQIRVDNPLWILNATETQLSQKANKMAAGFIFQKQGWLIDVDAYYNEIDGITTLSPQLNTVSNVLGFTKGSSSIKGVDVLIKKKWSNFNTWLNYSFGDARNHFPEISEETISARNDIRHNFNIITSYGLNNFQVSLNANYHSGLPYTLPDLVFNFEDPQAEPPFLYLLDYPEFNAERLKPYARIDFNFNYRLKFKKFKRLQSEISLSIINLFNTQNELTREYFVNYNEQTDGYSLGSISKLLLDRTPLLLVRFYW